MTYDPRYIIIGSSNGIVYERGHGNDRDKAVEQCRELVESSVDGTAQLRAWVWDRKEQKRIAGWYVTNKGKVRKLHGIV